MTSFRSPQELLQAVDDLMASLAAAGHDDAVAGLRDGLGCLNGLTDGWALFLTSIDRVRATAAARFSAHDRRAFDAIRAAVHHAVYGRR